MHGRRTALRDSRRSNARPGASALLAALVLSGGSWLGGVLFGGVWLGGCAAPSHRIAVSDPRSLPSPPSPAATAETALVGLWVPSPLEVIAAMLQLARVDASDVVYDLGSGEGEIVIEAARRYGARGAGVELDRERLDNALKKAAAAGVTDRVTFIERDLFEVDVGEATVVTLYLLPALIERLRPNLLRELRPGTRIVSHDFGLGDWPPEATVDVSVPDDRPRRVLLWTVPPRP
jgi:SAM-dependent methyltransferase